MTKVIDQHWVSVRRGSAVVVSLDVMGDGSEADCSSILMSRLNSIRSHSLRGEGVEVDLLMDHHRGSAGRPRC